MSRLSPAQLRMAGLGTAVTIAVLVPLAAKAGVPDDGAPPAAAADAKPGGSSGTGTGTGAGAGDVAGDLLGGLGLGREARTAESARPATAAPAPTAAPAVPSAPAPERRVGASAGAPERISRCGPELASPAGVEAQTCVLSEGPDVWARTYYRNATGREIDAILTLMAPGGRTVQVRCAGPARDEPDTCETPREPGTGAARAHTAVAEFAAKDESGDAPLLLRSGSNTADDQAS
ncbi:MULTISPECIES: hypothetical protein [Streptomyces]|uniref:Uncharacterized protein n=2 Tax=Streptomyces TaxID=1883 RepID=A0ABU4KCW1_9ACTN|nr:hypothetical protein [Streptomyces roseolus]MDX2295384.1 hypothetical protein [Streptomyces roseolus]